MTDEGRIARVVPRVSHEVPADTARAPGGTAPGPPPSPARELTVGLVGCGRLGEVGYLPALERAAGVRIGAVADASFERRALLAARHSGSDELRSFQGAAELLAGGGVGAVVLATPADAHLPDAQLAADQGVFALVEKPPAPDAAGARELAELVPPPWIGFNRRFDPGLAALRETLAGEASVDLRLALRYRRRSWRPIATADDALLDLGPHLLDLARWLTGAEIVRVRAQLGQRRAELDLDLSRGRASLSCATDRPHLERVEARDPRGKLLGCHRRGGVVDGLASRLRTAEHPLISTLAAQLEALARAATGQGGGDLATAADGVATMVALEAARRSAARGGGWVFVRQAL